MRRNPPGRRDARWPAVLLGAAVTACAALAGASGVAHAASPPTAVLQFANSAISSGTQPEVTFTTTGVPPGAALYLQRSSNGGKSWLNMGRTTATSGTAKAPADPAGTFEYRMVITEGGTRVAASAPAVLTVTGQPGTCGNCAAPTGSSTPPWLNLIGQSVIDWAIGGILTWLWAIIF